MFVEHEFNACTCTQKRVCYSITVRGAAPFAFLQGGPCSECLPSHLARWASFLSCSSSCSRTPSGKIGRDLARSLQVALPHRKCVRSLSLDRKSHLQKGHTEPLTRPLSQHCTACALLACIAKRPCDAKLAEHMSHFHSSSASSWAGEMKPVQTFARAHAARKLVSSFAASPYELGHQPFPCL